LAGVALDRASIDGDRRVALCIAAAAVDRFSSGRFTTASEDERRQRNEQSSAHGHMP
jgi:hypothetical protein